MSFVGPVLRALSRSYPFLSGRGTLVKRPPFSRVRFSEAMIHARLSNGLTACVIPNDFIGRSAYYFGDVDPKITRTLQRLLAPGDTLVDIGANMGIVSLQAWRYVGPTGRVIAVEPQPVCCHAIRESVALNELTNVELHPIGLSNRAGRFDLYVPMSRISAPRLWSRSRAHVGFPSRCARAQSSSLPSRFAGLIRSR